MKKIFLLVLCIVLIASMVACSAPQSAKEDLEESATEVKEITIRVGHTTPPDSPYSKGVDYLAELLNEYSDGKITMQNFHSAQLGSDSDLIESVILGTVEMAVVSTAPLASFSKDFYIFDLPYLIKDREKAFGIMDGEIGQAIMDTLIPKGIKGVSFWENGFRQLSNNVRPVKSPADLKGLKIRTMENPIHVATFEALGAYATPMAGGELFTALQQGVVDGQDNPLPGVLTSKFYEVQKYVSLTGQFYSPGVLLINNAYYEGLPEATKENLTVPVRS